MADSEELEMRRIAETIPTRERGEAVWSTSNLAVHLARLGLMQSSTAGRFSPRTSLVGSLASPPATAEDQWPFLRARTNGRAS
jgi:hypothetical protein